MSALVDRTQDGERADGQMARVTVIDRPSAAVAAMTPLRSRILACLADPGSATTVAEITGESRQKVNYHLRALETEGLVREVGTRRRRGLTERLVQATARSYLVSPTVLGANAATPESADRLSSEYLAAVAARVVADLGTLTQQAEAAGKKLPTMTIDTEIRFASAADRAAFTEELADAVTRLVARYHDEDAPSGRRHRLVIGSHPMPPESPTPEPTLKPGSRRSR